MPGSPPKMTVKVTNSHWNGQAVDLQDAQRVNMPQTPKGSMFFTFLNLSPKNSQGTLSLASGGGRPDRLISEPQKTTPSWRHQNWNGNNLDVTNVSGVDVPIRIQAVGPGMPGVTPTTFETGKKLSMTPGGTAEIILESRWWTCVFTSPGYEATFAVIGGPRDDNGRNGYTFTVNADKNDYPNDPNKDFPPPGDYFITSNTFQFLLNWGGTKVFFACMSGSSKGENYLTVS